MPCHLLFIFTLSQGPTARDLRAADRTGYGTKVPGGRHDAGEGHRYAASSLDAPTWPRYLSDAGASEIAACSSSRVKGLKRTAMAFARRVNSRVVSSRWPVIIITGSRHPTPPAPAQHEPYWYAREIGPWSDQLWQLWTVRIRRTKVLFVATRATANMRPRGPGSYCS